MRRAAACSLSLFTAVILLLAAPAARVLAKDRPRKPKPALPAAQYLFHETHAAEHVTVAAEPCDTPATLPDTRLDYAHHGFLPIRVIIANDSDRPLSLDEARIHFIAADNTVVPAATNDELQRRLFSRKSAEGTHIPLPAPLPSLNIHHPPVDKQILADDADFGFASTTIAPHTTASGYLFYNTTAIDEPVLANAQLEVRQLQWAGDTKPLFTFEIALKPTPPDPNPATKAKPTS